MKRGDILLICILVVGLGAIAVFAFSNDRSFNGKTYAQITVDGEPYRIVELTEAYQEFELTTDRGSNVFRIVDNEIHIYNADCPDKLCIAMGSMSKVGERIVCLPNRVFVEIIGDPNEGNDFDAIVS